MGKVTIMDHPLIQHKIGLIRDERPGTRDFRAMVAEIAMLECYESTRDLSLEDVEITTPIQKTTVKRLEGKKLAIVPILRAGLGMVEGMQTLIPAAKVGHIGICRSDSEPDGLQVYYNKLPFDIEEREVMILDLMIGTGKTAAKAVEVVKEAGAKTIKILSVITCPEGVEFVHSKYPDIDIFCGALDDHLNEDLYIVPGIGDGGDRIFGTK